MLAVAGTILLLAENLARGESAHEVSNLRLTFPTGLASCPDGSIWVASTYSDTLVRLDPVSGSLREVRLPLASHPAGLACDRRGAVWFAASGLGLVGRLDPGVEKAKEFVLPSTATARTILVPRAIAIHPGRQEAWFTVESDGIVGRVKLDAEPVRRGFVVTELKLGERMIRPHGITVDAVGAVWVTELGADRVTRIDPGDESFRRFDLPPDSRPFDAASAPDGGVWITLLGAGALVRFDSGTLRQRTWALPSEPSSPAAVVVDNVGGVWLSDLSGNRLLRFDQVAERFTSFSLPVPRTGARALAVAPTGRVWFVGATSGRLGYMR